MKVLVVSPRGASVLSHAKFPLSTVPPQTEVGAVPEVEVKRQAELPVSWSRPEIWPDWRPEREMAGAARNNNAGLKGRWYVGEQCCLSRFDSSAECLPSVWCLMLLLMHG